jgi:hypothetical protein
MENANIERGVFLSESYEPTDLWYEKYHVENKRTFNFNVEGFESFYVVFLPRNDDVEIWQEIKDADNVLKSTFALGCGVPFSELVEHIKTLN